MDQKSNASESNANETICVNDNRKYFCHSCDKEIRITSEDYNCPTCNQGFIEIVETSQESDVIDVDVVVRGNDVNRTPRLNSYQNVTPNEFRNILNQYSRNITDFLLRPREEFSTIPLESDIWVDHGAPALTIKQIQEIPTAHISQDHIDMKLQCAVCLEDFTINEVVMKLGCSHMYHEGCITPWLKIHGTCPSCRVYFGEGEEVTSNFDENDMLRENEWDMVRHPEFYSSSQTLPSTSDVHDCLHDFHNLSSDDETIDVDILANELRACDSHHHHMDDSPTSFLGLFASPQTLLPRASNFSNHQLCVISSGDESMDVDIMDDTSRECDSECCDHRNLETNSMLNNGSARTSLTQSTSSQIPLPNASNIRNIPEYTISSDDESTETDHDQNLPVLNDKKNL